MATLTTTFQSEELQRNVTFKAIIPTSTKSLYDYETKAEAKPEGFRTLYLLNGWNGNHEDWIINSTIVKLADETLEAACRVYSCELRPEVPTALPPGRLSTSGSVLRGARAILGGFVVPSGAFPSGRTPAHHPPVTDGP